MRTSNLDKVTRPGHRADCQQAAEELERYLDAGLTATRELLAAFLNDLNDECLARWGPRGKPSAVSYAVVATSTAAASRRSSAATKG
jgi:hypothetical protein